MNETGTRTMTAAEAANSPDLWQAVERGEVRVTTSRGAEIVSAVVGSWGWRDAVFVTSGEWSWRRDDFTEPVRVDDAELLTVVAIPVSEQSENSPANVERLKARIAALEAELTRVTESGSASDASEAPTPPDTSYKLARGIGSATDPVLRADIGRAWNDAGQLDADDDGSGKDKSS